MSTIRRLTDEQRAIIDKSIPGGVVGYFGRLSNGHWPTFGEGKDGPYLGVCPCGEVPCHGWVMAAYRRDLLDAYEAKVADLATETRRNEKLLLALSRGWTLAQYEYADEHGLWAEHPKPCVICGVDGDHHGVGEHFNVDHTYQVAP